MSALVETREFYVAESSSSLAFERIGPETNPGFDRYLTLGGQRAYHVGNVCDTCEFFFERLEGANDKVSPSEMGDRLRHGVGTLNDELLRAIGRALPVGEYMAMLLELTPRIVQPGDAGDYFTHEQADLWGTDPFRNNQPHDPRTEYYRSDSISLGDRKRLFEFVVPMMPSNRLDAKTTTGYDERLKADENPTAFALSVLDVKQPADWEGDPVVTEHWCLAHYLLDGHHKMLAASRAHRPVRLLAFLSPADGVASADEIERAIGAL